MDTTRWGPDGWRLLHSIAYCASFPDPNESTHSISPRFYKRFFRSIQHILPCVYCRRSYAEYMKELPIDDYLTHDLFRHTYMIHNKVNAKLRGQGYLSGRDPSFRAVKKEYARFVEKIDCIVGWAFLYCIIFNYPEDGVCSQRRQTAYIDFFTGLRHFLPCERIREKYCAYFDRYPIQEEMENRKTLKKWLHRLEQRIRGERCTPFRVRCDDIEDCRVDKCDGKTCRKSLPHS